MSKELTYKERILTQDYLKEILHYNPDTGLLTWKETVKRRICGNECGYLNAQGYRNININGYPYRGHRLAWLYVYGKFPDNEIDHINHIRNDNRIINLRDVTQAENFKNKLRDGRNKSGVSGVHLSTRDGLWVAKITVDGEVKHLGASKNKDKAIKLRRDAELKYNFHPNHGK